jgi:hypothetical protein
MPVEANHPGISVKIIHGGHSNNTPVIGDGTLRGLRGLREQVDDVVTVADETKIGEFIEQYIPGEHRARYRRFRSTSTGCTYALSTVSSSAAAVLAEIEELLRSAEENR